MNQTVNLYIFFDFKINLCCKIKLLFLDITSHIIRTMDKYYVKQFWLMLIFFLNTKSYLKS